MVQFSGAGSSPSEKPVSAPVSVAFRVSAGVRTSPASGGPPASFTGLQQRASLYRQNIQCHFQFQNGRAEFWMLSDLLLQGLQNLVSTCNVRCRLGGMILFGIWFD